MSNQIQVPFLGIPGPGGPGAFTAAPDATPAGGIVQATNMLWVPCDLRTGQVTVAAPTAAQEGWLFAVADIYGVAPSAPIRVTCSDAGVSLANPAWNGSGSPYGLLGVMVVSLGVQVWRFSLASLQWRLAT